MNPGKGVGVYCIVYCGTHPGKHPGRVYCDVYPGVYCDVYPDVYCDVYPGVYWVRNEPGRRICWVL